MKKKYLAYSILAIALSSCTEKKKEKDTYVVGKYLYMTDNAILHTTKNCIGITLAKDNKGHRVFGMEFIDTLNFCPDYDYSYCTKCFDDASYEHVQQILARNALNFQSKEIESNSINDDTEF